MRTIYALGLIGFLLAGLGCSSTTTRVYDVSVKNDTDHTVTIWLTKTGAPPENNWHSPEQLAQMAPGGDERLSGMPVPPGKTADTGTVKGEFYPEGIAWLRIYDGQYPSLSALLAVSPSSAKRIDQPLSPGRNSLVVRQKAGKIYVANEPIQPAAPTP
jgi:hypothetical protein